jgi:hypothetical protein
LKAPAGNQNLSLTLVAVLACCCSRAVYGEPREELPFVPNGRPTVQMVVDRIQCEMLSMVRDDVLDETASSRRRWLLGADYQVAIALSLDVNCDGTLAPRLAYTGSGSKVAAFTSNGSETSTEAHQHNFSEDIHLSLRKIFLTGSKGKALSDAPLRPPISRANSG